MKYSPLVPCVLFVFLTIGCHSASVEQQEIDTALSEDSPKLRIGKLINIALDQNKNGEPEKAQSTLETAVTEAATIVKPSAQASAWNEIAFTYAKLADAEAATTSVDKAIAVTATIDAPERKAAETAKSALTYQQLQNESKTTELLNQAEGHARSAPTPFGKVTALLAVAFWSVPAKDNARAERLIEEVGELTNQLESPPGEEAATEAIRVKLERINQFHMAKNDFGGIVVAAQLIDPAAHDVYGLVSISSRMIDIGFSEDAAWLLDKAEGIARDIEDEGSREEAMQEIEKERQRVKSS